MNVSLTPEFEALINAKVASGRYGSASEVVREALRLFEDRELVRELRLEELRKQIAVGLEQLDRGEYVSGEQVFEELREKSRKLREQGT